MYLRTEHWKNGDSFTPVSFYSCDHCSTEICESHPKRFTQNAHYCWDCAFIHGIIDEPKYLSCSPIALLDSHAAVRDGKVVRWVGDTAPWERTNRHYRRSGDYRRWRKQVLQRDNHCCQHCGTTERLQAHHIKPFATHKKHRYSLKNGLTLCEKCHRNEHKRLKQGRDKNERRVSNE